MYCSNCGEEIRDEHTFCGHCGFDLSTDSEKDTVVTQTEKTLGTSSLICGGLGNMHCPNCHAELLVNNNFCEKCGRNVNPVTSDGNTFIKPKTAKKSGCGTYVLIGLIILVVVALIAAIFIVKLISEILNSLSF